LQRYGAILRGEQLIADSERGAIGQVAFAIAEGAGKSGRSIGARD